MKVKSFQFKRKYFKMIVSKKKKLEARINYSSVRKIKIGDKVRFFWENCSIDVRIIDIRVYQSFKEILDPKIRWFPAND